MKFSEIEIRIIRKWYLEDKRTMRDIADFLEVPHCRVRKYIHEERLARNRSEVNTLAARTHKANGRKKAVKPKPSVANLALSLMARTA